MNELERLIASSLEEIERTTGDSPRPDRVLIERALHKRRRRRFSICFAMTGALVALAAFALSFDRVTPSHDLPVVQRVVPIQPITSAAPDITAVDGTVWVSDPHHGRIVHLGGRGNEIGSLDLIGEPTDIEVAFGAMWIADPASGRLLRVDLSTGEQTGLPITLSATPGPIEVSADDQALWVVLEGRSVQRIDPNTGAVRRVAVSGRPIDVAARGGTVWILQDDGSIVSVDRTTLEVGARVIHVSPGTEGDITYGAEHLWFGDRTKHKVVRIDPTGTSERRVIHLAGLYRRIAVQPDVAWAISADAPGGGQATPISPYDASVTGRSVPLAEEPLNVAISATKVWVAFADTSVVDLPRSPKN